MDILNTYIYVFRELLLATEIASTISIHSNLKLMPQTILSTPNERPFSEITVLFTVDLNIWRANQQTELNVITERSTRDKAVNISTNKDTAMDILQKEKQL